MIEALEKPIYTDIGGVFISNTSQYKYIINDEEITLLKTFEGQLSKDKAKNINYKRMGNGAIDINYNHTPVGRVRLQKKKHWMQILYEDKVHDIVDGELNDFLPLLPKWVKYVDYIIRDDDFDYDSLYD